MALQLFQHGDWNVRVVRNGNEVRWVAKDVAQCFGYKRPKDAIREHVRPDWKCPLKLFLRGGDSPPLSSNRHNDSQLLVISDCGVYALFFGSKLPCAEPYRAWLFGEVLPAIQRTGTYSVATPLEDAHDVQELIRQHVSASVRLNPVVGADDTWYHEREIGDVHEYKKPRDSIMHHARQAGPDSWRYLYELQPDCPRFQRKWRVYRKRVLVRTLLRGNKRKTKGVRRWALNDALPKGQPLRSQARRGSATLARALPP
jgi:prophage antirepressor-like protein